MPKPNLYDALSNFQKNHVPETTREGIVHSGRGARVLVRSRGGDIRARNTSGQAVARNDKVMLVRDGKEWVIQTVLASQQTNPSQGWAEPGGGMALPVNSTNDDSSVPMISQTLTGVPSTEWLAVSESLEFSVQRDRVLLGANVRAYNTGGANTTADFWLRGIIDSDLTTQHIWFRATSPMAGHMNWLPFIVPMTGLTPGDHVWNLEVWASGSSGVGPSLMVSSQHLWAVGL